MGTLFGYLMVWIFGMWCGRLIQMWFTSMDRAEERGRKG